MHIQSTEKHDTLGTSGGSVWLQQRTRKLIVRLVTRPQENFIYIATVRPCLPGIGLSYSLSQSN